MRSGKDTSRRRVARKRSLKDLEGNLSRSDSEERIKAPSDASPALEAFVRARWLLMLMVLQSSSSYVLENFQDLIKKHLVVTLFLTMLIGAGGNAGSQSTINVIQGFSRGLLRADMASLKHVLLKQGKVSVLLGAGLAVGGFVRVYVSRGSHYEGCLYYFSEPSKSGD